MSRSEVYDEILSQAVAPYRGEVDGPEADFTELAERVADELYRLFADDGYSRLATSPAVEVSP